MIMSCRSVQCNDAACRLLYILDSNCIAIFCQRRSLTRLLRRSRARVKRGGSVDVEMRSWSEIRRVWERESCTTSQRRRDHGGVIRVRGSLCSYPA